MFEGKNHGAEDGSSEGESGQSSSGANSPKSTKPRGDSLSDIIARSTPEEIAELRDTRSREQFGGSQAVRKTIELDSSQ